MSYSKSLEKKIIASIMKIENVKYIEDSIALIIEEKVSKSLDTLKKYDEALSIELSKRYVNACKDNTKKPSAILEETERLMKLNNGE